MYVVQRAKVPYILLLTCWRVLFWDTWRRCHKMRL